MALLGRKALELNCVFGILMAVMAAVSCTAAPFRNPGEARRAANSSPKLDY